MKCSFLNKLILINIFLMCNLLHAQKIQIVSAENFYGQLAKEIGGDQVEVFNVLNNPSIDPHLFSSNPKIILKIYHAQIIIYNGDNYDAWMKRILDSVHSNSSTIINVATMINLPNGSNPHIWYRPDVLRLLAINLADKLINKYKLNKSKVSSNLKKFLKDNDLVLLKIKDIKSKYKNITVTATEPVYQYMTDALGFNNLSIDFQWKIMNDTEPSFKEILDFEKNIYQKKVRLIYYNSAVINNTTTNVIKKAKEAKIKVIPVNELMPNNITINQWLLSGLILTQNALNKN